MAAFTFFVLYRKHPFLLCCLSDLTGVETLKLVAVVNTTFLFCWGECVGALFLCTTLNMFKHLITQTNFLFHVNHFFASKSISYQILIAFANETQIDKFSLSC